MLKRDQNASNDKGGPRTRLGTKVVASIAAISLVASMCPGTAALAFANELYAAGAAELQAQAKMETVVTKDTHEMKAGAYHVTENVTINPDASGNAVQVEKGAKVIIYIDKGTTLTVTGADAKGSGVGHAAILLPEGSVLTVDGEGTLNATGGRAGSGANGGAAEHSHVWAGSPSSTGRGGHGGAGGGGAGAGIGTDGGAGGAGGEGGERVNNQGLTGSNIYGHEGKPGSSGSAAEAAGTFIAKGEVTVNAKGGACGEKGGAGGARGSYAEDGKKFGYNTSAGTSGGGGGGAVGSTTDGIGPGGAGGGGGGGGASGSFDGEFAFFIKGDLDDLWGHGGDGGKSAWGIGDGARGDEGANGGDDTNASKKYAKAGGAGGNSPKPTRAAFYFFKAPLSTSAGPRVNCSTTYGEDRHGTEMSNYNDFMVGGVTLVYDEEKQGVRVVPNKLNTQSNSTGALSTQAGDSGMLRTQANSSKASEELPDSGTLEIDGYTVNYEIAYYDDAGNKLDSAPTLPGQYLAIASFTCAENNEYSGDLVEPINIAKREVAKPTPVELTFVCADWNTGEGKVQEAFPTLGDDYVFVDDVQAPEGLGDLKSSKSLKSARDAGGYAACFRLADPATCQWAGESEDTQEIWVPWSIKLLEFDPNEVTYWGTAYNDTTTSLAYTGEPAWVRPWYTETRETDGKFPEWFTHWGSNDRPANSKSSAAVVYVRGDGSDEEGLVGYHTGDGGALEPVTAAQVYAWANGVDIGENHVDVSSGDKVWYEVGEDGWWVPLAVQGEEPEGADGHVVARDWDYVDKLGVMEAGSYAAYALFDEGTGFAQTALAEAAVKVGDDLSEAEVTLAKASYAYDGAAKEPAVESVVFGGRELVAGTDYEVSYEGNVNAGTAAALATGKGAYYGTARAAFAIKGADISKAKVALAKTGYTYDGKAKKPAVKSVALGGKALKAGTDYAVSYKGNVNAGTATATVTGKGNYAGTAKATFKIAKASQKISAKNTSATAKAKKSGKVKKLAEKKVVNLAKKAKVSAKTKVTYKKVGKAGGKKIAVAKNGKVTLKKGLKAGTYKVKVKLTAPASKNYEKAKAKTVTLTVKVK